MSPANASNSLRSPEHPEQTAPPEDVAGTGKQAEDHRTLDPVLMPNRLILMIWKTKKNGSKK